MCGVLCVLTLGEVLMLLWCVDNWVTPHKVRGNTIYIMLTIGDMLLRV